MKGRILTLLTCFVVFGLSVGCENNKKSKQQAKQARQDSLERVRQQKRQQRQDSLAKARADSIAAAKKDSEPVFNPKKNGMSPDGHYAVQVGAWRSKNKAAQLAQEWQNRGFENAFVVKYGKKATGNIWFRVRLGKFFTQKQAKNLHKWLTKNYQTESWISYI